MKPDREAVKAAVKKAGYEVSDPTGKQVVIPIGGMTCSSCANAVERATGKLQGVSHVSWKSPWKKWKLRTSSL